MSRNGSGTYSLPALNPVVTGTTISITWANNTLNDIATALTQSLCVDGQTVPTANLPMATYRHTGVGNATARTDYASAAQVQDGALTYLTSVAGTNTITATGPIGMAAYVTGQRFTLIAANAPTGAVTININSIGAKALTKLGTTAISNGDWAAGQILDFEYDGTRFQLLGINTASGTYAPLASPTFTGTPLAPTAAPGTNTTQIATTAFVATSFAPLASPALTGNPTAPTATAGDNDTSIATTAFVTTAISNAIKATSTSSQLTSGTTYTVTGLSGLDGLDIYFEDVSCSGGDEFYLQLGFGSTTYVTSGYAGTTMTNGGNDDWPATAIGLTRLAVAGDKFSGMIRLRKGRNNIWIVTSTLAPGSTGSLLEVSAGRVDVTAALTAFKVLFSSSGTFDDGYISYKAYTV